MHGDYHVTIDIHSSGEFQWLSETRLSLLPWDVHLPIWLLVQPAEVCKYYAYLVKSSLRPYQDSQGPAILCYAPLMAEYFRYNQQAS